VVALTVAPALALVMLAKAPLERHDSPVAAWLQAKYLKLLAPIVQRPKAAYWTVGVIALGEVVDDAIIDVENITRRLRLNREAGAPHSPFRVVLEASIEVRSAVVYGSLIVVLVLVPVFFLEGLAGSYFRPLALAYILAVAASLGVALIVTPALCLMLLARAPLAPRDTCQAGARPKITLAASEMASANSSALRSTVTSLRRGRSSGASASRALTPHRAMITPPVPASSASTMLSVSIWRINRRRPAPTAARTTSSRPRADARASSRLATFAHAINSTNATAARSTNSV